MRRNASLKKPDGDVPESATEGAGRSIDQWVAAALAEQLARDAPAAPAGAEPGEEVKARRSGRARAGAEREEYESFLAAAAASERRAIETATKTAMALGSVASWIERAQERLTETTAAASKAQEATAAVVNGAVGAIGQRLEAIERKVEIGGTDVVGETLKAIERLESRLTAEPARTGRDRDEASSDPHREAAEPPSSRQPIKDGPAFEDALRSFEARIADLNARVASTPKPIARRALSRPDEVQGAVAEIRAHQAELARPLAPEPASPRLRTDTADIASLRTDILTSLQSDPSTLKGQPGTLGPAVSGVPDMLRTEIEALRRSLDGIATRDDLQRLADSLQALSGEIAEARADGGSAPGLARDIEALQAEIRTLEARRLPLDEARLRRDLDVLTHKLDIAAASGIDPAIAKGLRRQLNGLRELMAGIAAPTALSRLADELRVLADDVAAIAPRQLASEQMASEDVTPLGSAVDDIRGPLAPMPTNEAAWGRETQAPVSPTESGDALEAMLLTLMEKLERVERKVPDPEALDQLERQVQGLAARFGELDGSDPGASALGGSMGDLLREVATWRDGAAEVAERAARVVVAETLGSAQRPFEIERHLQELMAQYEAAEERTHASLAGVHARLEDVVSRISSLESELAVARPEGRPLAIQPIPPLPRIDDLRHDRLDASADGKVDEAPSRPAFPSTTGLAAAAPDEADQPMPPAPADEILLEPGAGRPGTARPGTLPAAGGDVGADPDIKSSFIAAARRAAQAAAADAKKSASPRLGSVSLGSAGPTELLRRLRSYIEERRRPLLIGAAAIALALGTLQVARNFMSEPAPAVVSQADGGRPQAEGASAPSTPDLPALPVPASRTELPDPATTQSIGAGRSAEAPSRAVAASVEPPRSEERGSASPSVSAPLPPPAPPISPPLPPLADGSASSKAGPAASAIPAAIATRSPAAASADAAGLPAGLKGAAAAGNAVALFELASRTAEGRGVPRDAKTAAGLFEKAAEKGLAPAQYRTGNVYERGVGVARDVEVARSWYRRAAEGGNVRAMHNLAVLLAEGGRGKADYPAAIAWFQKAAEHGVRDSQFNLAVLYARGLGIPQDLGKAYLWLAVAASGGDEDAGKKRDEVAAKLPAAELQRAKAAFETWRPSPVDPAANDAPAPAAGWSDAPTKRASR